MQDIDGLWQEVSFAQDKISKFEIDDKGIVLLNNQSMDDLCQKAREDFAKEQEVRKQQREKEALARAERLRQIETEEERKRDERRKQQDKQIRDAAGNRWVKCEFCGKIALKAEFSSYGGLGRVNLGTCYDCSKNNPAVHEKIVQQTETIKKKYNPSICPDCGGQLREKSGRFGTFMGCNNYPNCKFTRRITGRKS